LGAWEILRQYQDQDFSYVDATRFAMMERLDIETFLPSMRISAPSVRSVGGHSRM